MMTDSKLTAAQFSMRCAFIAKNAADWAGDILTLPERCNEPADVKAVERFTSGMRGRLDRLDDWAGVVAPSLAAAAPDMLRALQSAEIKLARYMEVHGKDGTYIGGLAAEYDASLAVVRAAIAKATA